MDLHRSVVFSQLQTISLVQSIEEDSKTAYFSKMCVNSERNILDDSFLTNSNPKGSKTSKKWVSIFRFERRYRGGKMILR